MAIAFEETAKMCKIAVTETKLERGAKAAINQCLEVNVHDRVVIITDNQSKNIGEALQKAAEQAKSIVLLIVIEEYTSRPAQNLPKKLKQDISDFKPTVSIYAASGQPGELPVFRLPLIDFLYKELKCRHAHMIGINAELMEDGMNKDYDRVFKVTNKVFNEVSDADQILVTDSHGTDIAFNLDPSKLKWIPSHGKILPNDKWQNLPSGETFTSPNSANGKFAAYILGDYLSEKYGELSTPLIVTIEKGYITKVDLPEDVVDLKTFNAKTDFEEYIASYPDGNRLGELGIGTLVGLTHFVGNLLQDEKYPGVHIAFGHPYPDETGQTWDCPSHIDIIAKDVNITVAKRGNSKVIMENGVFSKEILED